MPDQKQIKFLSLYEPVHNQFERFCRARAFGQMDFRDLMNDTLVIAFQKFEGLQSEKAFLSFLFGICTRLLSNHQKKRKDLAPLDKTIMDQYQSDLRTDADAEVHVLHLALAKLPDVQKESIILFEIIGYSIKEIAVHQGATESAVKKRLERGRKKLVRILTSEPGLKIKKEELS